MDLLKKWQVYCCSESNIQETWAFKKPEVCPNNPRHEIDESSIKAIDQKYVESSSVMHAFIQAKSWGDTHGFYMIHGFTMSDITMGTTKKSFTMATKRCMYGVRLNMKESNLGDSVSIIINPDTLVGYVTTPITAGDITIHVSQTVVDNMLPGFYIKFGLNEDDHHMISEVDIANQTLTLCHAMPHDVAAYSMVYLDLHIVKDYTIDVIGIHKMGYGTFAGKVLPSGTVIQIVYKCNHPDMTKTLTFNAEYTY